MKEIKVYEDYSVTEDGKVFSHRSNKFLKGRDNGRSKLNDKQVRIIKHLLKRGDMLQKDIAKFFNVNAVVICYINKEITWSHIQI